MDSTLASLSKREVALLGEWERTGVHRVTTAHIASALAVSRPTAVVVLSRLAHKGALERIGRGIYEIRPMRAVGIPWATSALVAVATLLDGRDYYVGGSVALSTHHLTEQVYHAVIDVLTPEQRPTLPHGQAQIVFHTLRWLEAYHLGIIDVPIEGVAIRMSDPERTLLDLVDRPNLVGSSRSALSLVRRAIRLIDVDRIIAYATRWPRRAMRQRLGYILERSGVERVRLMTLLPDGRPTHVVSLLVDEPARGPIHSPWRVRANDTSGHPLDMRDDA
jgi:predicted transcriptional regulator of viral defense system